MALNGFGYKLTNGWHTHDPIQRVEFMNAPKLNPLKALIVTDQSSRSQRITERNATSARLIACLEKLTFLLSVTRFYGALCG